MLLLHLFQTPSPSPPVDPATKVMFYITLFGVIGVLLGQGYLRIRQWQIDRQDQREQMQPRRRKRRPDAAVPPQRKRRAGAAPRVSAQPSMEQIEDAWKRREDVYRARSKARDKQWQDVVSDLEAHFDETVDELQTRITQLQEQIETAQATQLPSITVTTLAAASTVLLVGSRGSGKTTLLNAMIRERHGVVYVFDPHGTAAKWPETAIVYGSGRNFAQVKAQLDALYTLMDTRAKESAAQREGSIRFPLLTLAADEWGSILENVRSGRDERSPSDTIVSLLKEGRKFKIGFIAGAHGDTVASIGGKGDQKAFLNSFDWIVYMGAFVTDKLSAYPNLLRELPWTTTNDGIRIPLIAVAYQPATRSLALLDLRSITAAESAWVAPATTSDRRVERLVTDALLMSELIMPTPTLPTSDETPVTRSLLFISDEDRARIIAAAQQATSRSEVAKHLFGSAGGEGYQKVRQVCDEELLLLPQRRPSLQPPRSS